MGKMKEKLLEIDELARKWMIWEEEGREALSDRFGDLNAEERAFSEMERRQDNTDPAWR